jgi:ATP-binding cassette subfamily B protein
MIVDRVVPRGDLGLLAAVGAGLAILVGFQLITAMTRAHLLLELRTRLDLRMTLGFVDHLTALPYAFFQKRTTGDLIMRVNSNGTIREILTSTTLSAILDGGLVSLYLILLFLVDSTIALLVVVLGALQVGVFVASRRKVKDLVAQNLEAQARSPSSAGRITWSTTSTSRWPAAASARSPTRSWARCAWRRRWPSSASAPSRSSPAS